VPESNELPLLNLLPTKVKLADDVNGLVLAVVRK